MKGKINKQVGTGNSTTGSYVNTHTYKCKLQQLSNTATIHLAGMKGVHKNYTLYMYQICQSDVLMLISASLFGLLSALKGS